MTFRLVPIAVEVLWRGRVIGALGLPIATIFPALVRWLETGVEDL